MRARRVSSLLLSLLLLLPALSGCGGQNETTGLGNGWEPLSSMELQYAQQFSVDYYEGGYKLLSIGNGDRFLTIPEGAKAPLGIAKDIVPLYQPIENIYLAATSAMCLFDELGALESIRLSGTKAEGWCSEDARAAMEAGDILYAGKYSEPDYELILSSNCELSIQSTMIGHTPEVEEKLESLGVPVLVDQASLEPHPLGRTEWIKLYAALTDTEEDAEALFAEQARQAEEVFGLENTGKTVAFFYISSSGYAIARKSGDYVTKMIEIAGGNYIFSDLGDPASAVSTVTLEMERFYADAKDADYIIYNSTTSEELYSLEELFAKNELLRDFRAVKDGNVWCTGKNLYQETTRLGEMISDIRLMLTSDDPGLTELEFLHKLQ